jgi:hypothetical protein
VALPSTKAWLIMQRAAPITGSPRRSQYPARCPRVCAQGLAAGRKPASSCGGHRPWGCIWGRSQAVCANTVRTMIDRNRLGERTDLVLDAVGRLGVQRRNRGDVDDRNAARRSDQSQDHAFAGEEHGVGVCMHHARPILLALVDDAAVAADTALLSRQATTPIGRRHPRPWRRTPTRWSHRRRQPPLGH